MLARARRALRAARRLRIARALTRYGNARGGLLAGGVAYSAVFSVAAALTIAWTVFMALLGSNERLRHYAIKGVNSALPGILTDGGSRGLIDPDSLVLGSPLNPASAAAGVILVWTATSVMRSLASSIQAMFGITTLEQSVLVSKLRAFAGFVVLAAGVLASSLLTAAAGFAGGRLLGFFGIPSHLLVRIAGFFLSLLVDAGIVVFLVRVMSGVRAPRADLARGALATAAATSILRLLGTSLVGMVSRNLLLASFTALATLLLWLNISVRIVLVGAAYTANPPIPYQPVTAGELHAKQTPNYVTASVPATLVWPHNPITGAIVPDPGGDGPRDRLPDEPDPDPSAAHDNT